MTSPPLSSPRGAVFPLFFLALLLWTSAAPLAATSVVQITPSDSLQSAINSIEDGGVIEMGEGIYTTGSLPVLIYNPNKRFTLRAAEGALVEITGGTSDDGMIYYIVDTDGRQGHVTFENLVFRDGFADGFGQRAGAVTVDGGSATFVDCEFRTNRSEIGGGALWIYDVNSIGAQAKCIRCHFEGNTTTRNGGAIAVFTGSLWVHQSQFVENLANVPGHIVGASGGAIHVANSTARISNSRFDSNQAAFTGGALYGIGGNWPTGGGGPSTEIIVSNSTFIDNFVQPDPSGPVAPSPTEGGAIQLEDDTSLSVYNSRLITNTATLGGGLSLYRASAVIEDTSFLGNVSQDLADLGNETTWGGAIKVSSDDTGVDATDRPASSLTVRDSYFQGRYGGVGPVAPTGGGIYVSGDKNSRYGLGGVSPRGTLASNRATLVLERVIFHDLDVFASSQSAFGGALFLSLTAATIDDSIFLGNDASDTATNFSSGGAIRTLNETALTLTQSTFADNSAVHEGGAIHSQGSHLDVSSSRFIGNEISPGVSESSGTSYGAAIWAGPLTNAFGTGTDLDQTGTVTGNVFSGNIGLPLFERDAESSPINTTTYENNQFFETTFGDDVYRSQLDTANTPAELNGLIITRSGAADTNKSPAANNSLLGSEPSTAHTLAAPASVIIPAAAGDASASTTSYVAYAWSGASATLAGSGATSPGDAFEATSGAYELDVDSGAATDTAVVGSGPVPAGSLTATPNETTSGGLSTLAWSTTGGSFLDSCLAADLGAGGTASGSVGVMPTHTSTYRLLLVTEQGGADRSATVYVGEPAPSVDLFSDGFELGTLDAWSLVQQ